MPIRGFPVPGTTLYVQKGSGVVTFEEAVEMKKAEMSGPPPGAERRYLTDLRGCELARPDLGKWVAWNRENTPPEYLGRVVYLVDEARTTAMVLLLSNEFSPTRQAEVVSSVQAALDYLESQVSLETLAEHGIAD